MGNAIGKKRKMALAKPSKKYRIQSHVVSLTSSSLNNLRVEFPKEIEEDLERRKIESFKALATTAGSKKQQPSSRVVASSDPAHELYEKVKGLDVPAIMMPKPWSEVDQILHKLKPAVTDPLALKASPLPKPPPALEHQLLEPETIDWELEDDLDDENSHPQSPRSSNSGSPKKIRTLETSLSFSTIHTVKEVEGGSTMSETVTNILKAWNHDSPTRGHARRTSSSSAMVAAAAAPRKVNVNPSLLSRIEVFS